MKRILQAVTLIACLSSVTILSQASATITVVQAITENICYGTTDGSINIFPMGGTSPYTYSWSNGATTQNLSGLAAGTYTVTVTDNTGATAGFTYNITQPAALIITTSVTGENCGGQNIGAISLNITNPGGTYTYHWSNGATTQDISNLTAAVYYVTITNTFGCTTIDSANVTQPVGVAIADTVTDVTCSGAMNNGAIAVGVQYGSPGYTYVWNDGVTTESRSNLTTGNYTLTVTDALGCTATALATVSELPGSMSINPASVDPNCFGGNNGTINITAVGSTGPYTYLWDDGTTAQNRTGLSAGGYSVTATSSTGCSATANIALGQPAAMNITAHPFATTCFGGNNGAINISASNGSSPYSFIWTNSDVTNDITGLSAGNYTVTVTDHNGCTAATTVAVTQPAQIAVNAASTPLSCSGGPTGSVITNVTGGTGPYSYWWGGGVVSADRLNVNSGNYNVTVTDSKGCTATATSSIAAYTPVSLSVTSFDNLCFGDKIGEIFETATNGTTPYHYLWNTGDTTSAIDSLSGGNYTVTVTDNNGCTLSQTTSIAAPPFPIVVNSTINDVSCFGLSNASITLSPANGHPPYSYKWGGQGTAPTAANLDAGNYDVSITDSWGCTVTATFTVTQPGLITPVATVTNVACFGGNTGAIDLSVTGGYAPFTYHWNDGIDSQTRASLHVGTYDVTMTDNHACTMTASATVNQPTQLLSSVAGVSPVCFGANTGTASVTATGGTRPYSYNWNDGVSTQNRSTLLAGTYSVTVTDANGCTSQSGITLTSPSAIAITATGSNVACNGANTGTIIINVTGGTSPYTYNWGGGITTQNRNNLGAGSYTVTVTDNAACTAVNTTIVGQSTNLAVTASATNASCFGGSNGAITASATGGTSPYTYEWNGGANSSQINNMAAGNYDVTVTDHAGCSVSTSAVVSQPALLTISATTSPATCFGGAGGTINITVVGGTGAYTYNWVGEIYTQNRTNLTAGGYTVTVTDAAGCTVSNTTTVTQPAQLVITSTQTNVLCNAGSNATIQLTVAGGVGSYIYNWGGGITSAGRAGLSQGSYTATVTDANGCTAANTTNITQPAALAVNAAITDVNCFGQTTGVIDLTVSGGTGPYTYNWGGVATQNRTGLIAGNYFVTVTDANACSLTATEIVTQSQQITTSISSITDANCFGASNGGINIHINGGTPAYTYLWSNGSTSQNLTGVAAGTYHVSISDSYGCTTSTSIGVTQPAQITFTPVVTNVLCNGAATGAIATIVNGGNGGFTYQWSNGATTGNISNIAAGNYTILYKDVQNCSASSTVQVTQPAALVLTSAQTNVTCNGGNTGTASVTVNGGTGGYTYNWSSGQTTAQLSQLAQGNYNITVSDANACSATLAVDISQVNSIVIGLTPAEVSCSGQQNGSIQSIVTGGAGSYHYTWSNGASVSNISSLAAGHYTVTVIDANNCSSIAAAAITQPTAITVTQIVTDITCFGSATGGIQMAVTGGTGAYQYQWSNGSSTQNITNLNAGSYSVTVKDGNGCSAVAGKSVSEPTQLSLNVSTNDVSCSGGSDGSVTSTATGGTGAYSYVWSNASTTANISNVQAGSYSLSVHDAAGCTVSAIATVAQPAPVSVQATVNDATCNGAADGSVALLVGGGAGGYTYAWSNQSTTQSLTQLTAGAYAVTVLDANACSATAAADITQPAPVTVNTTSTNYACANVGGTINVAVSGGTSPYIYKWQDGVTTQNRTGLAAASYNVTVTDQNQCTQTANATITRLPQMTATLNGTNVTCNGGNNGTMGIAVTGGTQPYNYNWSNAGNSSTIQHLTANAYSVIVTDANGCSVTAGAVIMQPAAIQLSSTVGAVNCFGQSNGSVKVTADGGIAPLTFAWSNDSTEQNLLNITAGNYQLTVTDANGCTSTLQGIAVTQPGQLVMNAAVTPVGCSGQNDGSARITSTGGTPPYAYTWSIGNNTKTDFADSLAAGYYTVTVDDNNGCAKSLTVIVTEGPLLAVGPVVQAASCTGVNNGAISLTVTGGTTPYNYNWSNGSTGNIASGLGAGNYTVTITDAKGCSVETGGDILISYQLGVHAAASAVVTTGNPVQLSVTANTDHNNVYTWAPAASVACGTCANTSANPYQTTTFTVYAVDTNGCKAEDTITVQVNSETTIFIPNAFTPNSDGVNDQFKIFGDLSSVYFMDIAVYDRWGEKVFESNDPNFEWDGTYRGEPAPTGVYVYAATAVFSNGTHKDFKGSVTLLR